MFLYPPCVCTVTEDQTQICKRRPFTSFCFVRFLKSFYLFLFVLSRIAAHRSPPFAGDYATVRGAPKSAGPRGKPTRSPRLPPSHRRPRLPQVRHLWGKPTRRPRLTLAHLDRMWQARLERMWQARRPPLTPAQVPVDPVHTSRPGVPF